MSRITDILKQRSTNAMQSLFGHGHVDYGLAIGNQVGQAKEQPAEMYRFLKSLYYNDRAERQAGQDGLVLGLRNPTKALVEFYVDTMWPGTLPDALPIEVDEENPHPDLLTEAIHQIWEWSNWEHRKQVYARSAAMLGDSLIKVATRTNSQGHVDSVYLELIDAEHLTDLDVDERDYLTFLRLDIPRQRRREGRTETYIHTEVWDKGSNTYRVWEHQHPGRDLDQLGPPTMEEEITSFGFDFIPFVHSKFIDVGDKRGIAAVTTGLVKAHELSRMASRLHQIMFRHGEPDTVLYSDILDDDGNPISPPLIDDRGSTEDAGGAKLYRLPSGWKLQSLIANLPYMAHLEVLNAMWEHLEQTEFPELLYGKIGALSGSDARSGRAIRYMLTPALARAQAARANAEAALVRAHQMALTIGKINGLPGFTELLDYETGALNHWFAERDIIPISEDEQAGIDKVKAETAVLHMSVGYPEDRILTDLGMTDQEVEEYRAMQPGSAATPDEASRPGPFDRGFEEGVG